MTPWNDTAAARPAEAGAYALWIELSQAVPLPPRLQRPERMSLGPGAWLYLGSAHGPGGLRARCGRHLKRDKPQRWHVDSLTTRATRVLVQGFPGRGVSECSLTAQALSRGASAPVPGLGSSDCRICPAHLLAVPPGVGPDNFCFEYQCVEGGFL